jgi:D-glycero-D-manno-heptose 1,7-bisphosphate phosphatase
MSWEIDEEWTLFLDRDGVINERKWSGYIEKPSEFQFTFLAKESIASFSRFFKHVFVVTNQQGISKKIMTECNLQEVHRYMEEQIEEVGGKLTAIFYAPQLASENSIMRKPNPGMALEAQKLFPSVDFSKSIMVGDTDSDILFGTQLGMKTVRILSEEKKSVRADLEVNNLFELKELWQLD